MMFRLFLIISVLVSSVESQACSYRYHGVIQGEVTLGFMFPFNSGDLCEGEARDLSTIQLVEAAIYAVNEANAENKIPGVNIGLEVWDSCYSPNVAIDRGISFLGDRRVSYQQDGGDNCGTQFKAAMVADLRGDRGPNGASLFSDAQLPVISYAATLPSLTTFPGHEYFSRTVPSDAAEAKAIVVLLLSQGWKYVSLVHDDTLENLAIVEAFQAEARGSKICIARTFSIGTSDTITAAVTGLSQLTRTKVVVTFLSSADFFVQFATLPDSSDFELISGHRAMEYLLSADSLALDIVLASPSALDPVATHPFDDYFKGLSPTSADSQADIWFTTFWGTAYSCVVGATCGPEEQSLHRQKYRRNPYVLSVIDSFEATVAALRDLQAEKCGGAPGACLAFMTSTPGEVLSTVRNVDVTGDRPINFAARGNPRTESYIFWGLNTQSGALTELARSVDGTFLLTPGFGGFQGVISTCGDPCLDPACPSPEDDNVTVSHIDGDILLAGMFAVNEFNPDANSGCGALSPRGVLELEAMLYAVDQVNRDANILPTLSLGVEGINTCGSPQRAGHQALQLVSQFTFGQSASGSRTANMDTTGQHLYGIIGPPTNDETSAVVSVVKTYGVTVVGYEAESHLLSGASSVPNFARVVPTYVASFFAVGAVLEEYGFEYVQVLLSEENYPLHSIIRSYFQRNDICVAQNLQIPPDDSGWDEVFSDLSAKPEARAILLTAGPEDIQRYMAQIQQRNLIGRYFLIVGDDWPLDDDFIAGYEDVARGALVVKTSPRRYGEFQSYVAGLDPAANIRNPWFREYWMDRFSCNLPGESSRYTNPCTGNEALQPTMDASDETAAYIIDAVYAMAETLHEIHSSVCGPTFPGVCPAMDDLPGDEVFAEFVRRTFVSPNEDQLPIVIGYAGDSSIPYHVYNIQPSGSQEVAKFESFALTTTQDPVFYAADGSVRTTGIYSVCNETKCLECERNGKDSVATTATGDIWIGGFFEISEPGSTQIECSDTLIPYNMQLLEAFLFAIDQINRDATILPDLTLGGVGFDSCGSKKRVGKEVGNFYSGTVDYRPGYNPNRVTIAGMIGGGSSDTTQALSNTLVNLDVNTVSYGATASLFSSRTKYPHVLRAVPSDKKLAEALATVLAEFGWKYVSVVYSDDVYGNDIVELFTAAASEAQVCIAMTLVVGRSTSLGQYDSLIDSLRANPQARVVLLLTSDLDTRSVLQAAERKSVTNIQWVGGDTWGSRDYVVQGAETTTEGAVTLEFQKSETSGFREYFTGLKAYTNSRNPWWRDFWSETFQCNLVTGGEQYDSLCAFALTLEDDYEQAPEVTYVVNAVKALAVGLHNAMGELCPGVTNHLCSDLQNSPDRVADIIRGATFTGADGAAFSFDSNGDGQAVYDILNIRPESGLLYTKIGSWNKGTLTIDAEPQFPAYSCAGRCDECLALQESVRRLAVIPGELQIPALIGVHEATAGIAQACGELREAGVLNAEAVLYAIGAVNADESLLKGVHLGTTIFDSCLSPGQGVRELSSYLSRTGEFEGDTTWRYIGGILGAEDMDVTRYTADIAEQYQYIQVAYSPVDSSANQFLLQTSPSLYQHFGVIQDILERFDWNFVLLVSDGQDSQHKQLAEAIYDAQSDLGFCVDRFFEYNRDNTNTERTLQMTDANVVILVMSYETAVELTTDMNLDKHITFIVVNTYPPPTPTPGALPADLHGGMFVSLGDPSSSFTDHLSSLRYGGNTQNPWFDELIATKYGCTANGWGFQQCTSSDRLTYSTPSVNVNNVIDAVYCIARTIDSVRMRECGADFSGLCPEFFEITPEEIRQQMAETGYATVDGRRVVMNNGSAARGFTLYNSDSNGGINVVGTWSDGGLSIDNAVYLEDTDSVKGTVESSRSTCTPKKGAAQELLYPSAFDQWWFFIVMALSVLGIVLAICFLFGALLRHHAPQAQVYSVFLMSTLLVSVIVVFAHNFLFALEPSATVCAARQVVFNVSLTGAFVSVFLLAVRIYRILAREKRITGPRTLYINTKSQLRMFTLLMILEVLIVVQALFFVPPEIAHGDSSEGDGLVVHCRYLDFSFPASLLYTYFLMVATLVVSVLALLRSKTILSREVWLGFICMIFCIILVAAWIVLGILQAHVEGLESAFLPATCSLSVALGYLLLLFFVPIRIYNLWREHDPFSDSASVISGEFRDPQSPLDDNIYNVAEDHAIGGQENHTYDHPAAAKKLSESRM